MYWSFSTIFANDSCVVSRSSLFSCVSEDPHYVFVFQYHFANNFCVLSRSSLFSCVSDDHQTTQQGYPNHTIHRVAHATKNIFAFVKSNY